MRKWAYLSSPYKYDDEQICKIMIYQTENEGTYVFLYNSMQSQMCVADEWYESPAEAISQWEGFIKDGHWTIIEDPMPNCQNDCILPIRVKGRDIGKPEWGKYEVFVDGVWIDYRE